MTTNKFSVQWRLEDNGNWVVIEIYNHGVYWHTYDFPLEHYKVNPNWTFKDQIESKIWGRAEGLNEIFNALDKLDKQL
jgi:hypothetical protein